MNLLVSSPLEQFSIIKIIPFRISIIDLSFTNSSYFLLLACGSLLLLFFITTYKGKLVPTRWQIIIESFYEFVLSLVSDIIGKKGLLYFPLIFVLFAFLLGCNLIGMIPYSFTVTSHIIITFSLSLILFIGMNILGFYIHGLHFFSLLVPKGAPQALLPFLVAIESVSYLSRVFSLAIRLFANMMAGHTLVKILAGFGWTMLTMKGIWVIIQFIPFLMIFAITGLEIGVAFLQAYVFTVLVCIYLNDVIHLH
uniref:ATP synthase subunit a n=1 Tax=Glaucocystis nostochinearum TaxID=38271 RepID=E9P6E8_9EUKA|nr:ATP synthase F0 subunit a [Glaucocystis nostochinearum]ADW83132.1 ATP synthase F0 subunit a [Glaucocystis nostochinearum]